MSDSALEKRGFTLGTEKFAHVWPEAKALAQVHSAEVGDNQPWRPFDLDLELMQKLEDVGSLKIAVARVEDKLVGYFSWQISLDVESCGNLMAQQGAFYVTPGHPHVAYCLAIWSLSFLRVLGVKYVFPHYRTQGRGKTLGRFWKRLGAKEIQTTCVLRLEERDHAQH